MFANPGGNLDICFEFFKIQFIGHKVIFVFVWVG
jgi:hypothetical protein